MKIRRLACQKNSEFSRVLIRKMTMGQKGEYATPKPITTHNELETINLLT